MELTHHILVFLWQTASIKRRRRSFGPPTLSIFTGLSTCMSINYYQVKQVFTSKIEPNETTASLLVFCKLQRRRNVSSSSSSSFFLLTQRLLLSLGLNSEMLVRFQFTYYYSLVTKLRINSHKSQPAFPGISLVSNNAHYMSLLLLF